MLNLRTTPTVGVVLDPFSTLSVTLHVTYHFSQLNWKMKVTLLKIIDSTSWGRGPKWFLVVTATWHATYHLAQEIKRVKVNPLNSETTAPGGVVFYVFNFSAI